MRRKPLLLTRDTVGSPASRQYPPLVVGGNRGGVVGPAPPTTRGGYWRSWPRTAYLVACVALEFPDGATPPKRLMEERLTLQQSLRYGLFAPLSKVVVSYESVISGYAVLASIKPCCFKPSIQSAVGRTSLEKATLSTASPVFYEFEESAMLQMNQLDVDCLEKPRFLPLLSQSRFP